MVNPFLFPDRLPLWARWQWRGGTEDPPGFPRFSSSHWSVATFPFVMTIKHQLDVAGDDGEKDQRWTEEDGGGGGRRPQRSFPRADPQNTTRLHLRDEGGLSLLWQGANYWLGSLSLTSCSEWQWVSQCKGDAGPSEGSGVEPNWDWGERHTSIIITAATQVRCSTRWTQSWQKSTLTTMERWTSVSSYWWCTSRSVFHHLVDQARNQVGSTDTMEEMRIAFRCQTLLKFSPHSILLS